MTNSRSERRVPFARFRTRVGRNARGGPLQDYSVLLGLLTVGSVLLIHSIGARLTDEWHALTSPMSATSH